MGPSPERSALRAVFLFLYRRCRAHGAHLRARGTDLRQAGTATTAASRVRLEPRGQPRGGHGNVRRQSPLDAAADLVRPMRTRPLPHAVYDRRAAVTALVSAVVAVVALAWPVEFGWERTYSPYQLLERGRGEHGLMLLRAAGPVLPAGARPLADRPARLSAGRPAWRSYYELPYEVRPAAASVAIVGAGTGNDVAAALRARGGRGWTRSRSTRR